MWRLPAELQGNPIRAGWRAVGLRREPPGSFHPAFVKTDCRRRLRLLSTGYARVLDTAAARGRPRRSRRPSASSMALPCPAHRDRRPYHRLTPAFRSGLSGRPVQTTHSPFGIKTMSQPKTLYDKIWDDHVV